MEAIQNYFLCDDCENKDFKRIYNFSIKFHGVNFSEDLIYDKNTDEIYQCTGCGKTYSAHEIEKCLDNFKKMRKRVA